MLVSLWVSGGTFQFFPSCCGHIGVGATSGATYYYLSILSQLLPSYSSLHSFANEFLSILSQLLRVLVCGLAGAGCSAAFNSFPVAAGSSHSTSPLSLRALSILSQLLLGGEEGFGAETPLRAFQFFPSCCTRSPAGIPSR